MRTRLPRGKCRWPRSDWSVTTVPCTFSFLSLYSYEYFKNIYKCKCYKKGQQFCCDGLERFASGTPDVSLCRTESEEHGYLQASDSGVHILDPTAVGRDRHFPYGAPVANYLRLRRVQDLG